MASYDDPLFELLLGDEDFEEVSRRMEATEYAAMAHKAWSGCDTLQESLAMEAALLAADPELDEVQQARHDLLMFLVADDDGESLL